MKIEIANRQSCLKIKPKTMESLARLLMKKVARLNPLREWSELSIALVDETEIVAVNALHLDRAESTDVISYAYEPTPPESKWSGEVVINTEMARKEGAARGDIPKELALYLAHGCDHLSGADDATERDRQKMRRRELRWLKELDYSGIIVEYAN